MLSIIQLSYSSKVDNGAIWGIFSPFLPQSSQLCDMS